MNAIQPLTTYRRVNSPITKRIFELHECGYIYDFKAYDPATLVCLQNDIRFLNNETLIKLIDLYPNTSNGHFTYIHTVDTFQGCKGLMLSDKILCNNNWL